MQDKWLLKVYVGGDLAYSSIFTSEAEAIRYCNTPHSSRVGLELVKL